MRFPLVSGLGCHDVTVTTAATPKGERRRQALVEAAAELILEGGIEAVRHRAVATRAGLPLASTTYYFDSLEQLVVCAMQHNGARDVEIMRARVEDVPASPRSPETTAELVLDLLVGNAESDDDRDRLVARHEGCVATVRHPELREAQVSLREQIDDLLTDLLERCGREVRVPQLHRLVVVVDGAVLCGLVDVDPDPRAAARAILVDVMHTVAPPAEP